MAITVTPATLPEAPALVGRVRDASVKVLTLWSRNRNCLGIRFTPQAFGLYGLTRRTKKYARTHPAPFVNKGKFRDGVASGQGIRLETKTVPEGFQANLYVTVPRGLNFVRGGGIYLREWQRLYAQEATAIDGLVANELPQVGEQWTGTNHG